MNLVDMNRIKVGESMVAALRLIVGEKSFSELADELNISRQAMRQMLVHDNKNIKYSTVNKICKQLGYHVELVKNEE